MMITTKKRMRLTRNERLHCCSIGIVVLLLLLLIASAPKANAAFATFAEPSNRATQIMEGGPRLVDMNQYNLYDASSSSASLDEIQQEWTANLKQKVNEKNIRVELGVQSNDRLFADTVQVYYTSPRTRQRPGLGIELVQIKGGSGGGSGGDGKSSRSAIGITVVAGLVPGGAADGLDIIPGDSITKVTLIRELRLVQKTSSNSSSETGSGGGGMVLDQQQTIPVVTECLDYDSTVNAIRSLPECNDEKYVEHFIVTLKRIRRKPKVKVKLQYPPEQQEQDDTIELFAGENLRMGMLKRGVKLNDPLAKRFDTKSGGNCGAGGLCRTCAVSILHGGDMLNPQRLAEQQMLADTPRWRLACKAIVGYGMKEGEISIRVNPRQFVK